MESMGAGVYACVCVRGGIGWWGANCFNPYYSNCMALFLSRPVQPLINIPYIWQCFLYHCLLMGGIIAHSIIRQSAKDQLCLRSPGSHSGAAQNRGVPVRR